MATYNTTVANLRSVMDNAPTNTTDTPHIINLTDGITSETQYNRLVNGLGGNEDKYIELSIPSYTFTFNNSTVFHNQGKFVGITITNFTGATDIHNIFENCFNLKFIDIKGLNNVTNMNYIISGNYNFSLESVTLSGTGTCTANQFINVDYSLNFQNLVTVNLTGFTITSANMMFSRCDGLTTVNFSNITISGDASYMFWKCSSLEEIDTTPFTNVTNASGMFKECRSLVEIDTTPFVNVTNASGMFAACDSLTEIDTSPFTNVINASEMFLRCSGLTEIDTTPFTNVTNASGMFNQCSGLTEINTTPFVNVTNASRMFAACDSLTEIDTSPFTNVINADYMFAACRPLTEIDATPFVNVTSTQSMFSGTNITTILLPDLSSVTNASHMFEGCFLLEEIHGWSVPLTATMTDCFTGCTSLQAIYVPEVVPQESTWHTWDIQKDTANTRSDVTIYGTSGTPVTAQIPSSGTYSLEVSGMTDELLFSSTKAITSAHIQKMMQTQTPITGNTDALDPTKDNFVMLAKDRTAAKTNVTTDVVEAGNLLPPTSAAVHAAIDANKSGGIPLGGWTSFENDTAPNDEWLQAGTTFDSDTYPELFLYLGGNTVPERYDHNRPGDYEPILLPSTSATAITAPYDGEIIYTTNHDVSTAIYINDTLITSPSVRTTYGDTTATFSVKKGDKFYVTVSNGIINVNGEKVRWYTHPMFIKATTTASSYTPSSAVQEIKDYTKDYVDAKNSYSTNETLTGGIWIDGKPIYKKTYSGTLSSTLGSSAITIIPLANLPSISTLVEMRGFVEQLNNPHLVHTLNDLYTRFYLDFSAGIRGQATASRPAGSPYAITIEYTKTTD